LGNVLEEDRERIAEFNKSAFVKNISKGEYDAEFRTLGAEDGKVRWVRAKGKVFFNEEEQPLRFIGSVLEITDQKENEMRKNDFIGVVSHELKTPLTSLKAYIQILSERSKEMGDTFQADALFKVDRQINKMSVMINSFLDVSRLESGKIHMNFTRFSIRGLIEEIISESLQVVPNHKLIFLPGLALTVEADRDKVGQVITNLISNAAKYSERGKNIIIDCEASGFDFRISVRDEGIGISAQDSEHLFERFYRVENPQTRQISGFGIGLYLSSEIVRRHKGRIWVKSTMGAGSTFFF
jgi:signal transduction histidine kinase